MTTTILIAAGALCGFLVGLTGVGGGAVMTPILLFLGFPPAIAVGTDLWFASITKLFASRIHHSHNLIDWVVARRLWAGSLPASGLAVIWLYLYSIDSQLETVLKSAIAIAIIVTACGLLLQKFIHALGKQWRTAHAARFKKVQVPLTFFAGAVLGVLVTITSVGAGALGAVFLLYLYPRRLTPPRLIATDLVHAIPLALFAGSGHWLIGNIDLTLLATLLIGSIPAATAGAFLASKLPAQWLRSLLAMILLGIGTKLSWDLWS